MAVSTTTAPELTAEQVQRILVQPLEAASTFLAAVATAASVAESEDPQDRAFMATVQANAAASSGDHKQALDYARQALEYSAAISLRHDAVRWAWTIAADAALALGDETEVTRLVSALEGHRPGHVPPVLRAERLRIRARILANKNDPAAAEAFDAATEAFRDLGSPYHLAVGLLDSADHLLAVGNSTIAQQLAAEADTVADRLPAPCLTERARGFMTSPAAALASRTV